MWRKIRVTVCHRLHQRRAILTNRDIQRDIFPPIYHGLWHGDTILKNQRWNSGQMVLMLPALIILLLSGRMPCTDILCWSQYSGWTSGLIHLLKVSSSHSMSPAWSEPTLFFAELILKRTNSADIWTIPAISPAFSMSNERKTAFWLSNMLWAMDLPLGHGLWVSHSSPAFLATV